MTHTYQPDPEYRFWVYDPAGDGMIYYKTEADRDAAAQEIIDNYLDDTWGEEVENVCCGVVTHSVQMTNRRDRPDDLDEEGCDGSRQYWPDDVEYFCNYEMIAFPENAA